MRRSRPAAAEKGRRLAAVWQRLCAWFGDGNEGEDTSDLSGKVAPAEKTGPTATYAHIDVTSPEWTAAVATAVDDRSASSTLRRSTSTRCRSAVLPAWRFPAWLLWLLVHRVWLTVTIAVLGRGRAERAITGQQVFGRQALAAPSRGGDVVD